ncbi:MAG: MBOAT family protein [Lachnospiraceae bacterium]|nr:MBOAT family protein [Lachnospiraceae bacterium]
MLFNTPQYIIFLPIVVIIYYVLPKKVRYLWLLVVSYYFYMQWNPLYITLLFSCTLLTYICGRIIERLRQSEDGVKRQRICLAVCILLNLCILGYFKYFEFGINCLNWMFRQFNMGEINWKYNILLPVGISFYVLQALGYLIDVYRGDMHAEKNFLRYALFVSFFPQLVAGPIERSQNLLVQLHDTHPLEYENIRKGALLVLYGLFLKMVIADRAAIIVDTVYGDTLTYQGVYIVVATIFFSIQIYCDFYGYSTIARGSALLMGIRLMDNFQAPYYARSVKEFWRRWHISLSGWFRDYLYIPLGGSRKGQLRKESNLLTVFTVSGLWHGASLSFVLWGLLNGIYQVFADVILWFRKRISRIGNRFGIEINDDDSGNNRFSHHLFKTAFTFTLVTFAWLFFRAGDLKSAHIVLADMIASNNWTVLFDGSLYELGVARNYMNVLIVSVIALFAADYQKYQGKDVAELILKQGWWFRVMVIMLMIFAILLYGCYGEMYDLEQFIYFQF